MENMPAAWDLSILVYKVKINLTDETNGITVLVTVAVKGFVRKHQTEVIHIMDQIFFLPQHRGSMTGSITGHAQPQRGQVIIKAGLVCLLNLDLFCREPAERQQFIIKVAFLGHRAEPGGLAAHRLPLFASHGHSFDR